MFRSPLPASRYLAIDAISMAVFAKLLVPPPPHPHPPKSGADKFTY